MKKIAYFCIMCAKVIHVSMENLFYNGMTQVNVERKSYNGTFCNRHMLVVWTRPL